MALDVCLDRSAPAILQALRDVAPGEAALFEGDFREALRQASATFDLSPVDRIVTGGGGSLTCASTLPLSKNAILRAGEDVGWASPEERLAAQGR
jgi:hypothetical protein